jgi:hypothetical protein
MTIDEIAVALKNDPARIVLTYAFNSTGKTQLSVAFKNATKRSDGTHAGVYYNAFSEDLFVWDNDEPSGGADVRLTVLPSSLSRFHASLTEDDIRAKLRPYQPKYGFALRLHKDDPSKGIEAVSFFLPDQNPDRPQASIKISRGEERIFVWCLFLALFEVEGWADKQDSHFFVDDPVSSLDDHNIFVTASTLMDLIDQHVGTRKIIITTHHIGLFSILSDWLTRGEKASKYEDRTAAYVLSAKSGGLRLENCSKDVFLYHLRLLQILQRARADDDVRAYHLALLRQVLENVASFLGEGRFAYVLEQIGVDDPAEVARIINVLSHKKVYYYESDMLTQDTRVMFDNVFDKLKERYKFRLRSD